jgi:hypothetical protein
VAASLPVSSIATPGPSKLAQRINANRQATSPPIAPPPSTETTIITDPLFVPSSKEAETLKAKTASAFGAMLASPSHLGNPKNHKKVMEISIRKALGGDTFMFNTPNPDDIVLNARRGTSLASRVR